MSNLKAGFARVDITPNLGIPMSGHYIDRIAEGILDNLEANCIAVNNDGETALFVSVDILGIPKEIFYEIRELTAKKTGVAHEAIVISATHTHTGPQLVGENKDVVKYRQLLIQKLVDCAVLSIADLKPAKMGWAIGTAPNIAFVRRFKMKDGGVRTNPGLGNPDIVKPIGEVDERVSVIRFNRESDNILLVNFANHPDVVGGCKISADWPGLSRRMIERCLPGTKCSLINGAEGDINHVNVKAEKGELNDLKNDFDDVLRGYGHARHLANVVAGAVLQVYDKVNYMDETEIRCFEKKIAVPSNKASEEELALAHKYAELHNAGKDSEIPFEAMELTTVVAEALRMVNLENAPESFEMTMTGIAIGNIVFITIPGEGFNYIGRELKKASGWNMVVPCGLSNGYERYFPTKDAYDEGGYEARSSHFKSGVAEIIIEEGKEIFGELK